MYGEGHSHSIVQCGLGEALACQEMRERTLAKPSTWTRCPQGARWAGCVHDSY